MALGKIHTRYSRFIFNAFKNSRIGVPISKTSPILQKRFYSKNREHEPEWFHFRNPIRVSCTAFFFSCGLVLAVASGDWITVPYTGKTKFIFFNKFIEKFLPDTVEHDGETLPPQHPDCIMARRIYEDIVHQASIIEKETTRPHPFRVNGFEIKAWFRTPDDHYHKQEKVVEECEDGEIVVAVLDDFIVQASDSFRKMYVTDSLLDHYRKHEPMIATLMGKAAGHSLAKHSDESVSNLICIVSGIGMSLYLFCKSAYILSKIPCLDNFMRRRFLPSFSFVASVALLSYLTMAKCERKIAMEGDYIGLMMAASAGYNPREGRFFPVLGENLHKRMLPDCFYPIPRDERRWEHLSQPKVINEAISRYNQALISPWQLPRHNQAKTAKPAVDEKKEA